jgi:hypothetical protein
MIKIKRLLLILILTLSLQSLTMADDIRDFEIEGMSIGDSLLNFYSKTEIQNFHTIYYPNSRKFYQVGTIIESNLYDALNFNLKTDDSKYIIYAIKGLKNVDNQLDKCLEQKKNMINQILQMITNTKEDKFESNFSNNYGKSISYISEFNLSNGTFHIACSKWDKENKKIISNGWWDSLNASLGFKEWHYWLNNEAY